MKVAMHVLAAVAVVAFVGSFALAATTATAPASKPAAMEGTFVKMDEAKMVMKVKDADVTVLTDEKTTVTIDGKEGKLAGLTAGMKLVVTPGADAKAAAVKVVAKTPPAPKNAK